ncbi:RNA-guided endonuclease InsQ/TnpB family protein [Phytoactinopolyspora endophytica]|uniref:RNA-guided endonuclease InsQ/TnpB family protein n=1 Tax=Phytoactinopolyspora endophytica TaxID=1642495 RepID=UPI0013ECD2A9|nr:helix-turn-helix domain-containing protein [Phytoactinopolyspora endophytica]
MIASKRQAPRHGPGHLVVDGTDKTLCRKATFAFDPSPSQERRLLDLLGACCEVYNAGLQERRDAWKLSQASVSLFDQFKQVSELRRVRDDVLAWGIQPLRGALRRLDEAFSAFYRRLKAGQTPGYPRFKSRRRFDTASWDEPRSWKVDGGQRQLYIQGIGTFRLPKPARRQLGRLTGRGGTPVTLTVTRHRAGGTKDNPKWVWRATVGFTSVAAVPSEPHVDAGSVVGADRGVAVTLATSDGGLYAIPEWIRHHRDRIVAWQQE